MSVSSEKTTLEVSFPNEKLEALRFYMSEKELTVEDELQKYVDNIYQKYVPAPTRRYLDRNENEGEIAGETTNNTRKSPGRKRTLKSQNATEEGTNVPVNGETPAESSEEIQEGEQGMVMTM